MKIASNIIKLALVVGLLSACVSGGYSGKTAYQDISSHDPTFQSTTLALLTKQGFTVPQSSCIYREGLQAVIDEMGENYVKTTVEGWRNSTDFASGSSLQLYFLTDGVPFDPLYYSQSDGGAIYESCDIPTRS